MKNPDEIKELAKLRLKEAKTLCNDEKYDGAFYLAGYSIELMLKAKICENFGVRNLFDFNNNQNDNQAVHGLKFIRQKLKTHDINELLIFSGLYPKFKKINSSNEVLFKTIGLLFDPHSRRCFWNEQLRYQLLDSDQKENIKDLIRLLEDEDNGFLYWIERGYLEDE